MVKAIDILVSGCDWCGWDIGFLLIVTLCQDTDFTLLSLLGLKKKKKKHVLFVAYTQGRFTSTTHFSHRLHTGYINHLSLAAFALCNMFTLSTDIHLFLFKESRPFSHCYVSQV